MSDVIWAALIAVGGSSMTGALAYLGARLQAGVARAASFNQAQIELSKVEAENQRLREQLQEPERQNRQTTYHRLVTSLDRFDSWATGFGGDVDDETYDAAIAEFYYLMGAVNLFGAQQVRDAAGEVAEQLGRVGAAMAETIKRAGNSGTELSKVDAFIVGYAPQRLAVIDATAALIEAMRSDVTRGHLPEAT